MVQTPEFDPTLGAFKKVDAGVSVQMQNVSSESLLDDLNQKCKRLRLAPFVLIAGIIFCSMMYGATYTPVAIGGVTGIFVIGVSAAAVRDTLKKTTVLMYDLDPSAMLRFANLTSAFERAAASDKIWHVQSEATVLDRKYHAGAGRELTTDDARLTKASPPGVKTNIQPLAIRMPRRNIYLFPDRLLLRDAAGFGAADYPHLEMNLTASQFVPGTTTAPRDATVVGNTWRYVNKAGGPDRRFANNPQLPVLEVRDLLVTSGTGLTAVLKFSNIAAAEQLREALMSFTNAQPPKISSTGTPNHSEPAIEDQTGKEWSWLAPALATILCSIAAATAIAYYPRELPKPVSAPSAVTVVASPAQISTLPSQTPPSNASVPRVPSAPSPSMTVEAKRADNAASFVTLRAPASIKTPTGRVVIARGTRLPFVARKHKSVWIRYYDGHDYEIPVSATEPKR